MSEQGGDAAKRLKTGEPETVGPPVLPAEMFELIIAKMNVNEWIACRAVCKFFKQVVDRIKLRSLAIAENEDSACESVFEYWEYEDYDWAEPVDYKRFSDRFYFVSNDPVYESYTLISPNTTAGLRMLVNHFDLLQLRRLFVVEVRNGRAHFDLLNRLIQLEHLQINWIQMDDNLRLQLPNLRTLSIVKLNHSNHCQISLATPNLKHFETQSLSESKFRFEDPASVVFLQVSKCTFAALLELRSNLEVLVCEWASSLVRARQNLNLPAFQKLQRVDCARMDREEAKELQRLCKRNEVEFYFCGCRIDNLDEDLGVYLEEGERDQLLKLLKIEHMFDNYGRLADSMYLCEGIRYWKWFACSFPNKLPENFAKKFYLVRDVYVAREIENVNYFIDFLSCFKNLKVLWLQNAALSQEFFDRHSHLFARLHEFKYQDYRYSSNKIDEVNMKFILMFKLLEKFETNMPVNMRLISEAFNNLKHLKFFFLDRDRHCDDFSKEEQQEKPPRFAIHRTEDGYNLTGLDPSMKKSENQKSDFTSKAELLEYVEERFPALSKDEL